MSHAGVHTHTHIFNNIAWSKYCISVRCSYVISYLLHFQLNITENIILLPNKLSHYKLARIYIRFELLLCRVGLFEMKQIKKNN